MGKSETICSSSYALILSSLRPFIRSVRPSSLDRSLSPITAPLSHRPCSRQPSSTGSRSVTNEILVDVLLRCSSHGERERERAVSVRSFGLREPRLSPQALQWTRLTLREPATLMIEHAVAARQYGQTAYPSMEWRAPGQSRMGDGTSLSLSLYRREKATLVQTATDETWGQRNPELRYVHGSSSHHSPRREVRRAETKGEGRGRDGTGGKTRLSARLAGWRAGGLGGWLSGRVGFAGRYDSQERHRREGERRGAYEGVVQSFVVELRLAKNLRQDDHASQLRVIY